MLKNIPFSFTPDLLYLMTAMGHGEEILIGDGNFPALKYGHPAAPKIYLPVTDIPSLLCDIFRFFPVDETVEAPLTVMEAAKENGVYQKYRDAADRAGINAAIGTLGRFDFYEQAAKAAGFVITASTAKGGNILIKKGVVQCNSCRDTGQ
jgi:L-fucose mutarotase